MLDPLSEGASGWELRPPSGKSDIMRTARATQYWWPGEHVSYPSRAVYQIPVGQTAMLRRQSGVRLATAIELDDGDEELANRLYRRLATIDYVVSDAPNSVELVARSGERFTNKLLLDGVTRSRPLLVGVESTFPVGFRARFGVRPPPPLDSLHSDSIAVSNPLFFSAAVNDSLPSNADQAIARMIGRQWISERSTVGVFGETYGTVANDTLLVELMLRRDGGDNFIDRIGAACGFVPSPTIPVAISWKQVPSPAIQSQATGSTPSSSRSIVPRSLIISLPTQAKGSYVVSIRVETPRGATAIGKSLIEIR